jgi:hypothetical protein
MNSKEEILGQSHKKELQHKHIEEFELEQRFEKNAFEVGLLDY